MLDPPEVEPLLELPRYCWGCGAFLMGGATRHAARCPMLDLIAQNFPGLLPLMEAVDEPEE